MFYVRVDITPRKPVKTKARNIGKSNALTLRNSIIALRTLLIYTVICAMKKRPSRTRERESRQVRAASSHY